jgi:hypothetical protein
VTVLLELKEYGRAARGKRIALDEIASEAMELLVISGEEAEGIS